MLVLLPVKNWVFRTENKASLSLLFIVSPKQTILYFGNANKNELESWGILRGDSFQLEISDTADVQCVAYITKAILKSIDGPDVLMTPPYLLCLTA